ncbi:hypothetical protein [Streptomyces blattellae]|uniref:hypothetical protein n=1 Tax=Streptomyces blattellae TaxID=2569855 RepID=UPI001E612C4F|nr:hypothetical protein [Streptomyces blattellae]
MTGTGTGTNTGATMCGARRPGWEWPDYGHHRLPCVLGYGHDGDHRDALGHAWLQRPGVVECVAVLPDAAGVACLRIVGHDGPHRDVADREWAGGVCEVCGSAEQPHVTVTTGSGGTARHRQVCQRCARSDAAVVVRRPVRMCVRCDRITDTPVLVSEVHQNSGPGFSVYACGDCAPHFPPLPDVFDLLQAGRRDVDGDR